MTARLTPDGALVTHGRTAMGRGTRPAVRLRNRQYNAGITIFILAVGASSPLAALSRDLNPPAIAVGARARLPAPCSPGRVISSASRRPNKAEMGSRCASVTRYYGQRNDDIYCRVFPSPSVANTCRAVSAARPFGGHELIHEPADNIGQRLESIHVAHVAAPPKLCLHGLAGGRFRIGSRAIGAALYVTDYDGRRIPNVGRFPQTLSQK